MISLKKSLSHANKERDQLYIDLGTAMNQINDLEQYTRKHNLEIHGIPEQTDQKPSRASYYTWKSFQCYDSRRHHRHLSQIVYWQEPNQTQANYSQIQVVSCKEGAIWSLQKSQESKLELNVSRCRHRMHKRKSDNNAMRTL